MISAESTRHSTEEEEEEGQTWTGQVEEASEELEISEEGGSRDTHSDDGDRIEDAADEAHCTSHTILQWRRQQIHDHSPADSLSKMVYCLSARAMEAGQKSRCNHRLFDATTQHEPRMM